MVHSLEDLQAVDVPYHLKIDTGMNRSGLPYWEVSQLAAEARRLLAGVDLQLTMSHLACADVPEHPLNARLFAEDLFIRYREVFVVAGGIGLKRRGG